LTTLSARSKSRGSCWLRFEIERSCSSRGAASRAQRGRRARRHTVPRLLDPHDHRQALVTLAEPALGGWRATRHLVEALIHCVLTGSDRGAAPVRGGHAAPADALRRIRRAVRGAAPPLRQGYSLTETGPTCLDVGPPERVERDTVGTPLHDIDLRVGDDPTQPCEPERVGRIWVRPPRRARPGPARDRATGGRPAIAKRRRSPLELTSNS
jgi:hypothetical protein